MYIECIEEHWWRMQFTSLYRETYHYLAESFCSIVDIGSSAISSYNDCRVGLFQPQLSTFLFSPTFNHQMKLYSIKKLVRMFLQD